MTDYEQIYNNPTSYDPQYQDPNNPQQQIPPENTPEYAQYLQDLQANASLNPPPEASGQGGNLPGQPVVRVATVSTETPPPAPELAPKVPQDAANNARIEAILDARADGSGIEQEAKRPLLPDVNSSANRGGIGPTPDRQDKTGAPTGAELLVDGLPESERAQKIKELNRPLAAAQYLEENWDKWKLGKEADFAALARNPGNLPQEAQDMIKYINEHPALQKALDVGRAEAPVPDGPAGFGNPDNKIAKGDVHAFIENTKADQRAGAAAFQEWKKANPNAGELATEVARSAATLIANQTLLQNADPQAASDKRGVVSQTAINSLANQGFGAVSDAARLFGQPGMFANIDKAGVSAATNNTDKLYDVNNVKSWLKNSAPRNDKDVLDMFKTAAAQGAIDTLRAGGNGTAGIGKDMFIENADHTLTVDKNKYTVQQRAAALIELQEARAKLKPAVDQTLFNDGSARGNGVNPNPNKIAKELDERILALASDPDLNKEVDRVMGQTYQSLANADPVLKAALEKHYGNYVENGAGLTAAANKEQLDASGNKLSAGEGVAQFIGQAQQMARMLGKPEPDLPKILEKPELAATKATLVKEYEAIVDGKRIDEIIKSNEGKTPEEVLALIGRESIALTSVMDPALVEKNKVKQNSTFSDRASALLVKNTPDDQAKAMMDAFTTPDGKLDEAKVEAVFKQLEETSPEMFTKQADGKSMVPDIIKVMAGQWNAARGSAKLTDGMDKVFAGFTNNNSLDDLHKSGMMHGVSAFFGAMALTARATTSKNPSPSDIVSMVGNGMAMLGTAAEGSTKAATNVKPLPARADGTVPPTSAPSPEQTAELKKTEARAKLFGGAGNIISGVIGIVDGVRQLPTNRTAGALNVTSGTLSATAGVLAVLEGGAALYAASSAAVLTGTAAGATAATNFFGMLSGAVGVAAGAFAVGVGLYQAITLGIQATQIGNDTKTFWSQFKPVLDRYGITGGDILPGDEKPVTKPPMLDASWAMTHSH